MRLYWSYHTEIQDSAEITTAEAKCGTTMHNFPSIFRGVTRALKGCRVSQVTY